jgi:hypothetical protein
VHATLTSVGRRACPPRRSGVDSAGVPGRRKNFQFNASAAEHAKPWHLAGVVSAPRRGDSPSATSSSSASSPTAVEQGRGASVVSSKESAFADGSKRSRDRVDRDRRSVPEPPSPRRAPETAGPRRKKQWVRQLGPRIGAWTRKVVASHARPISDPPAHAPDSQPGLRRRTVSVSVGNAQRTSAGSGNSGRTRANHHSLAPPWPHEVGPAGKARRLRPAEDL